MSIYRCQLSEMKQELKFRALTLADEIWIQDSFPDYSDKMTGDSIDKDILTKILYRVLINRDLFKRTIVKDYDENGEMAEVTTGGLELFRSQIVSEGDLVALLSAFIEVCNKSRPDGEKLVKKKRISRRLILWPSLMLFALGIIGVITRLWV